MSLPPVKRSLEWLGSFIREVPDFPKAGITFKDITPLLQNKEAFAYSVEVLADKIRKLKDAPTQVVAIESRGFIFGAPLAIALGVGLTIIRKPKKLPHKTAKIEYALEYGLDTMEMHADALTPQDHVVVVDDILATGGTAKAAGELVESTGAKVQAMVFLSELAFLKGRAKLAKYHLICLLTL